MPLWGPPTIKMAPLTILQINTARSAQAAGLALRTAARHQASIVAVTEPHRNRGALPSTAPYNNQVSAENAALLIRRDIDYRAIAVGSPNIAAAVVSGVCVLSVYLSPNEDVEQTCELLDDLIREHRSVIVTGDLNCRLEGYSNRPRRRRDRVVQSLVEEHGLDVLNDQTPTMDHNGVLGINDYTMTKQCETTGWHVLRDTESLSDHRYIVFRVPGLGAEAEPASRLNAATLRQLMESTSPPQMELKDADSCNAAAKLLTDYLSGLVDEATELISVRPRVCWWNDELEEQHRTIKRLRRRAHRTGCMRTKELIAEMRVDLRWAIDRAKKNAWREFVTTSTPWGKPYKAMVVPKRTRQMIPGEILLEQKIGGVPIEDTPAPVYDDPLPVSDGMTVTPAEVIGILKTVKNRSAPGLDQLSYKTLKIFNQLHAQTLAELFSACLRFGIYPEIWKPGKIIWIPKPGKDPCDPGAYRPITLLSCLGKVYERCIAARLLEHIQNNSTLSHRQFGFLPNTSTEDSVRSLLRDVENARTYFNVAAVVAIDIKGAFDNINWKHLTDELRRYQLPCYLQAVVGNFLKNRKVTSGSASVCLEKGCPQGSVIGPLIWNLAYNYVLDHFNGGGVSVNCYADDTVFVVGANSPVRLSRKIGEILDEAVVMLAQGGLELSAEKTEVVVFTGYQLKYNSVLTVPYRVLGKKRRSTSNLKYLGLMIDCKLSWDIHIKYLIEKSKKMIPKILAVATNIFGYSNNARRIMLQGTVGAYFRYCSSVYCHALPRHRKEIESLHREMVRCCGRLYRTVSYYPGTVIANYPPLELDTYRSAALSCWRKGLDLHPPAGITFPTPGQYHLQRTFEAAVEELLLEEWQRRYAGCGKGEWTRGLLTVVGIEIQELDFYLAQALSGHGVFRAYLLKYRRVESDLCECGEPETPHHVFKICHLHATGRPTTLNIKEEETRSYLQATVRRLWEAEKSRERSPQTVIFRADM